MKNIRSHRLELYYTLPFVNKSKCNLTYFPNYRIVHSRSTFSTFNSSVGFLCFADIYVYNVCEWVDLSVGVCVCVWISKKSQYTETYSKCMTCSPTNNNNVRFECNSAHIINKRFTHDAFAVKYSYIDYFFAESYLYYFCMCWYLLSLQSHLSNSALCIYLRSIWSAVICMHVELYEVLLPSTKSIQNGKQALYNFYSNTLCVWCRKSLPSFLRFSEMFIWSCSRSFFYDFWFHCMEILYMYT